MSFSLIRSRALIGTQAAPVAVETHLANGLPAFTIVGLAETAVKESRDRVRAAIINSRFEFPARRITVNLAPADMPKEGARFDLAIAMGILSASGQIELSAEKLQEFEFIGELALNGQLRFVNGVLPTAFEVQKSERSLALPLDCLDEAALIENLKLVCADSLIQLIENMQSGDMGLCSKANSTTTVRAIYPDMSEVKGQQLAKRALQIAAAGRHNILMVGPPGCGKSMLASRLPGLLPDLSVDTAIEVASIQSISNQGFSFENWQRIPYRSPHHGCSAAALIGGGSKPVPGEISLAHGGILFLDEIAEFNRQALEMLREPLEVGYVNIARVNRSQRYLADVMLVAAANPCHCGYYGSTQQSCRCSPAMIERYQNKLSGPLLDRIDMHIELSQLKPSELLADGKAQSSVELKRAITQAQQLQLNRQGKLNSALGGSELEQTVILSGDLKSYLTTLLNRLNLTARAYHRVLRLARTIADLQQSNQVQRSHIVEALQYRTNNHNTH